MNKNKSKINLEKINTLISFRKSAQSIVNKKTWDWMEGGSEREWTLRSNTESFRNFKLVSNINNLS